MSANRLSGLFFIAFGVLLFAVVIPWQVETVAYGWLKPRTLPRILAVFMVICGAILAIWPPADRMGRDTRWSRAALFAALLAAALALMSRLGFVLIAPVMALVIMLLAGERRPLWLILGAGGMPLLIWLVVAWLLERPLP
ncbi:MAG: tripartite tricarboxylate transporter TctB family protein [Jhaorihella sp.]